MHLGITAHIHRNCRSVFCSLDLTCELWIFIDLHYSFPKITCLVYLVRTAEIAKKSLSKQIYECWITKQSEYFIFHIEQVEKRHTKRETLWFNFSTHEYVVASAMLPPVCRVCLYAVWTFPPPPFVFWRIKKLIRTSENRGERGETWKKNAEHYVVIAFIISSPLHLLLLSFSMHK